MIGDDNYRRKGGLALHFQDRRVGGELAYNGWQREAGRAEREVAVVRKVCSTVHSCLEHSMASSGLSPTSGMQRPSAPAFIARRREPRPATRVGLTTSLT